MTISYRQNTAINQALHLIACLCVFVCSCVQFEWSWQEKGDSRLAWCSHAGRVRRCSGLERKRRIALLLLDTLMFIRQPLKLIEW